MNVLTIAAACEATLGVALLLDPQIVFRLLLGTADTGPGSVMGRVAGAALSALALACWPQRAGELPRPALRAMLTYNALATLCLVYVGLGTDWVGPLLWPAVVLHTGFTAWCLRSLRLSTPLLAARALCCALAVCAPSRDAAAHETRPAYVQIEEVAPGRYDVLWRTPVLAGMRLPVRLELPETFRSITAPTVQELSDSLVERRVVESDAALDGARIDFRGLQATITDVLVRVAFLDGTRSTTLVRPSRPWVEIDAARGPAAVAAAYFAHGVEHILLGFDHLLFVFALVLIVRSTRVLLWTITAFTLAHSITLALATLGLVHVPAPPVEATIALSILLLAVEIIRFRRGEIGLSVRWPWAVAFPFGLLHGFGFAGALSELGLPAGDIPLALCAFNVGVECGQLGFVCALLVVSRLARRLRWATHIEHRALRVAPYCIGVVAAFWLFERIARF
jgi:hydrogenase/urease accessory protein HupE